MAQAQRGALPGAATTSAVGDAASAGTAGTASAQADHRHGREAFAIAVASAPGDAAAAGVAVTISRSDHVHGRERVQGVVGGPVGNASQAAITTTASPGTAITSITITVTIVAGRKLKITAFFDFSFSVASTASLSLWDNPNSTGNVSLAQRNFGAAAGALNGTTIIDFEAALATGTHVFTCRAWVQAGAITPQFGAAGGQMFVEDVTN